MFVPITKNETWKFRRALVRVYCYYSAPHVGSENRNSAVGADLIIERYRFPKKRELKSAWHRQYDKTLIRSIIMNVNRNRRKENHVTEMISSLSFNRKENWNAKYEIASPVSQRPRIETRQLQRQKRLSRQARIEKSDGIEVESFPKGATIRCTFFAAATKNNQPAWMRAFFRA